MPPRTMFLAKLIGLFLIVFAVFLMARRESAVATFVALAGDAAARWLSCLVGVAAGLALVLTHNIWSGGAVPVSVTLIGWVTLIKSVIGLLLPPEALGVVVGLVRSPLLLTLDTTLLLGFGVYLAAAGFRASNRARR